MVWKESNKQNERGSNNPINEIEVKGKVKRWIVIDKVKQPIKMKLKWTKKWE